MSGADSIRILIVDDHQLVREGTRWFLEPEADFEVVGEAVDGEEAIAKARDLRPDAITMDINLPRMNGIEATRIIHGEFPDICIIALSVYGERQVRDLILDAGASDYIGKGHAPEFLVEAIRRNCKSA